MSYTTCNKCGGMCLHDEQPCHFCEKGKKNPSLGMNSKEDFEKAAKEILIALTQTDMKTPVKNAKSMLDSGKRATRIPNPPAPALIPINKNRKSVRIAGTNRTPPKKKRKK